MTGVKRVLPSAEDIADRVLTKAKLPKPPINPQHIARAWEDLSVVEEELDGSGYLLPLGKLGAEIVVNKSDPPVRRHFTIAHELGHWVLGLIWKKRTGRFMQPPGIAREQVERWCDSFATNLLMPRRFVEPWLAMADGPMMVDALIRGPRDFNVSEQAFFIRAWELSRIQMLSLRSSSARGHREFQIEKNYGDNSTRGIAVEFLQVPWVRLQLQYADSVILFSGKKQDDIFHCSGRKFSGNRALIAVKWEFANEELPARQLGGSAND